MVGAVPRPAAGPMSEDERLELLDKLRYKMIDVLDSGRGRWVAAIVFLAAWSAWTNPTCTSEAD